MRCRTPSSRSAAPPSRRRRCTARSRRPAGRTHRCGPSRAGCARPRRSRRPPGGPHRPGAAAPRGGAGTPGPWTAGTWARRRTRRSPGPHPASAPRRPGRASRHPVEPRAPAPGCRPRSARGGWNRLPGKGFRDPRGSLLDLAAARRPGLVDGVEHLTKGRKLVAGNRREVGAGVEGRAGRGEEHRHRPATLTGQRLGRGHVDGIDVGPLLAVDLDVDEVLVHLRGRGGVLEALVRHHVAPVTGRIADRQQHRHVTLHSGGERLVPPLLPVDRIVLVLHQVWAARSAEPVHVEHVGRLSRRRRAGRRHRAHAPTRAGRAGREGPAGRRPGRVSNALCGGGRPCCASAAPPPPPGGT